MAQRLPPGDNWFQNETLVAWQRGLGRPLEPREAASLAVQLCDAAIQRLEGPPHRRRMHIAPDTIRVRMNAEGRTAVALLDNESHTVYATSYVTSTGEHGSFAGNIRETQGTLNESTHVYNIGAILYQLATGQPPLPGAERPRADAVNPRVSRALANTIEQAMAYDPQVRFGSVVQLRAALQEVMPRPATTTTGSGEGDGGWIVLMAFLAITVFAFFVWQGGQDGAATNSTGGVPPVLPTALPATPTPDGVATLTAADGQFQTIVEAQAGELPAMAAEPSMVRVAGPLADFAIVAVFVNPPTPSWDYGFAFRRSDTEHYRLSIASDGQWRLVFRTEGPAAGSSSDGWVSDGAATGLLTEPGAANNVGLLVVGQFGCLFINEQRVTPLDLGIKIAPGDVYVAAGLSSGANGAAVSYSELNVRGPK